MPEEQEVTRKLRAILSADVKGYSFLMADDKAFTIRTQLEFTRFYGAYRCWKIDRRRANLSKKETDMTEIWAMYFSCMKK